LNKPPRIGVIGHLVTDEIIMPNGSMSRALGGISYNLASLGSVIGEGIIFPICVIGADIQDVFDQNFGDKNSFDLSFVKITSLPNVVNKLVYNKKGEREEWNSRIPENITLEDIGDNINAALFNFISGDDAEIGELRDFKNRFRGPVYCDFHSLALGRDYDGKRFLRQNNNWRDYISIADIIQLNQAELATITDKFTYDIKILAGHLEILHDCGPAVAILTLGSGGAIISDRRTDIKYFLPAIDIGQAIDPTGCGDTFASVFFNEYLISNDVKRSALRANLYAAAKATFSGVDGFKKISETTIKLNSIYNKCEII